MKVKVNKIHIPKKRVRFLTGRDVSDLKNSIEKLGLLEPIVVDKDFILVAGFRRLKAIKELGWEEIDVVFVGDLTESQKFLAELEENTKRQNLTDREINEALLQWKELYEIEHPETSHGGDRKSEDFKKKNQESDPDTRFVDVEKIKKKTPAPRFTQIAAQNLGVSETVVKEHLQVAEAVQEGKLDENKELLKKYEEGKKVHYQMLEKVREKARKEKQEKKKQLAETLTEITETPQSLEEFHEKLEQADIMEKMEELIAIEAEPEKFCYDCSKARHTACPHCWETIVICKGVAKNQNARACDDFTP